VVILRHLLAGAPDGCDVNNLRIQCARFLNKTLPPESLKWFQEVATRDDPLKSLVNSLRDVLMRVDRTILEKEETALKKGAFLVRVKNLIGKEITVVSEKNDTVLVLKQKIEEKEGIPTNIQRLVCRGSALVADFKTLEQYGIDGNSTVHLLLVMLGGGIRAL